MAVSKTRAFTVRLPEEVYRAGAETAKRKKVSLNRLMQESLEATLRAEDDARLTAEFDLVGRCDDTDVEFAVPAILEVLERDEQ